MKRFILLLLLSLTLTLSPIFAQSTSAKVSYGGFVLFSIPCTCPPFGLWIYMIPLWLNSAVPVTGALYYPPVAVPFSFYHVGVPSTYELGAFIPGPGMCSVGIPPACVPLPALGTVLYTGTSLPTFPR